MITAKDYASIQISVADVDENGVAQRTSTSFAISGQVRAMGESDDSINRLATQAGCESPRFSRRHFYVLMPLPLDFLVGFSGFSRVQCSETFGRIKSRRWLMFIPLHISPLYACYRSFVPLTF